MYYFVDSASDNPTFYADLRKPQSLNKYQYAYNNPLRWIDPDGHDPEEPEPQNPVAVPVPVGPGGLPLPIPLSPTTPGPSDQQIKSGFDSLLDHIIPKPIDDILYVISQKLGTAPPPVVPPMPLAQPLAPPPPITAGKGSTRDVRKINPGRAVAAATAAAAAAVELARLKAVPNKTKADAAAVEAAKRALKRALDRQRKSETDARRGRGDRR